MKSATKILVFVFAYFGFTHQAPAGVKETLLRNAALDSGYLAPRFVNSEYSLDLSIIGKQLFESDILSFGRDTKCSTCHLEEFSSADGLPNAIGVGGIGAGPSRILSDGAIVPRNTLPLWGRGALDFPAFFWDGKVELVDGRVISQFGDHAQTIDPLSVAVALPSLEIREMVASSGEVDHLFKMESVEAAEYLQELLVGRIISDQLGLALADANKVELVDLNFTHVAEALSHHIRREFALQPSPFSLFIDGQNTLSELEIQGGLVFYGKGRCSSCHSGPHFSDFKYHNIVVPQVGFGKNGFGIDYGRFNVTQLPADIYRFRTPPLSNVAETGPYTHSGALTGLPEVIISHFDPLRLFDTRNMDAIRRRELYARIRSTAGEPIPNFLTEADVEALAAFLGSLTFN